MVYFDNNATTPLDPAVIDKMTAFMRDQFGNPSSLYPIGRQGKEILNEARDHVARSLGAAKGDIYFTGSGTESDNQALLGVLDACPDRREIVLSTIEHPGIQETAAYCERKGVRVTYVPVDSLGSIDLGALRDAVTPQTALVSVMHANNEIGTIQPIALIAEIAHEKGALMHTDAVQSYGKIDVDVNALGIDLLTVSGHKIYGPKGVGALYVRKGTPLAPFVHGGHQERGLRAGTENTIGIVGFGEAARILPERMRADKPRLTALAIRLRAGLEARVPKLHSNGHPENRVPTTLSYSVLGLEAEAILLGLATKGIYISTGSACSEDSEEVSHVLKAIGLRPEFARSTIRMSLGRFNTDADVDTALDVIPGMIDKLRRISAWDPDEI
ncbi:MAG: aminotransferase class V-fold PLP-dependent enzyme [Candidatus Aminicenantes bacterium]|nr:aminotransferase class V-fold PLP-dependent enzyme [Candidatus Aminicenantes bacterium]